MLARELLLLAVAFDWDLPIRLRANTWLEVFGNCLVQERTQQYIEGKGAELISFVCDNIGGLRDIVDIK